MQQDEQKKTVGYSQKKNDDMRKTPSEQSTEESSSEALAEGADNESPQLSEASSDTLFARQDPAFVEYQPGRILCSEAAWVPEANRQNLPLQLADMLDVPPPPAPFPSVGSMGHHFGNCKPCDFVSRFGNGCRAGTACKFCHLCGPNQHREFKRARRALARATR